MNTEVNISNKEFTKLLNSIDSELGRDDDSLNLLDWVVEDYYERKIKENLEYHGNRPDLISITNERIMFELDTILKHFIEKEEYEKCDRIIKIKKDLVKYI